MADSKKAKSAKERLAQAKKAATDAEVLSDAATDKMADAADAVSKAADVDEDASAHAIEDALNAAETPDESGTSDKAPPDEAKDAGDPASENAPHDPQETGNKPETTSTDDPSISDKSETEKPEEAAAPAEESKAAPRSLSATLLTWLLIFIVGAVAALGLGPRIAPSLPAPIAKFFTPGSEQAADQIAAVKAESAAAISVLSERIVALEASVGDQTALTEAIADVEARLSSEIETVASAPKQDLSGIEAAINGAAGRVTAAEATLEGLRTELDALAGISGENAPPSAEVLSRVVAFGAAVEGLRSEVSALSEKAALIETLAPQEQVTALAARVDALEGGEAATTSARDDAADIRRTANIEAALTRITQALASGEGFADALSTAVSLSGEPAPDALAAVAEGGAPTSDELARSFGPAAQRAYAASLKDEAGDGFASRFLATLEGRVGGRPAAETDGEDAGAVLSRIEARLGEGRLDDALGEAEQLSEAASGAMAGWLGLLKRADDARTGLNQWRDALGAN